MKLKALSGAILSTALAFATLVGIASPASAATLDMTGVSIAFTHTKAASLTDFTAGKYWPVSGATETTDGSIDRYNTVATVNGVAIDAVVTLNQNCTAKNIASITASGGTLTVTTTTAHGFVPNQTVTTAGNTPAGYNLTAVTVASVVSSTVFTITNAATGTLTTAGTVKTATCPTVGNYDAASGTSPDFDVDITAGVPYQGATFNFAFYEHGTYTGVNTGTPVVLKNATVNVADLDSGSASPTDEQFAEFSGFQSYLLNKRAAGACSGGDTSLVYNASTNPRCDNANINVAAVPGTNLTRFTSTDANQSANIIQDVAAVKYDSFSSIDVKLGNIASGKLGKYIIQFAAPTWGANGAQSYANANNTPPQITGTVPTLSVASNVATTIRKSDFGTYYDFDNNPFYSVKITSLPASGSLQYNNAGVWTAVTVDQVILVSDIDLNKLRFTGSASTSFGFKVNDSLDYSTSAYTLSIVPVANTQTITFANPGTKAPSAGTFASNATASSNLTVSISSSTTGVCTTSGLNITIVASGSCTITATQAGDATYAAAAPVVQTFTVSTLTGQTITFNNPGQKTKSATAFASGATSSSGLTVTLASLTTNVCTVSGLNITAVSEGTCDIKATQDGNATTAPASPVEQLFQVVGPTYTLTFDANGATGGSVPAAVSSPTEWQVAGNTGSLTKSGYTWSGWTDNSNGTGTTYAAGDFITLVANKTIYAKWVAASYTITYADGGSTGGSLPSNTTGSGSVTLALNTGSLVKTGYYFNGWTISATNYSAGASYTLSGNVTATARWSQYTVTYDANGATSGSIPSATVGYGSTSLASNSGTLAKTGYYFDGWTIAATPYAAGASYSIAGDVTAYATWSQYTVTYAGNGNTSGSVPAATGGNGSVTLASNSGSLAKTGYYFNGWTISATNYAAGDSYTLNANVTATARWSQYTVTYVGNGNTSGAVPSSTFGYGSTALASNSGSLAKTGYYFNGWTIGGVDYASGASYSISGDVTATAKWSQYTITYADGGSTGGSLPSNTSGSGSVTLAANSGSLVKTGYYFNGWTISATNYAAGDTYTLNANVTATARWSQYTITYVGNGNTSGAVPSSTLGYGSTALASNSGSLANTGYDFAGWTIGGTDYAEGASYNLTGNVTATAKWTVSAYHITYTDTFATSGSVPSATGGSGNVSVAGKGTLAYSNHYFAGWDIGGIVYSPADLYNLTGDVTATAVWSQYSISYGDDFADSGVNPGDTVGYGNITLAGNDNNLGRTGYYFDGWDISGVHYAAGATYDLQGLSHATPHWSQYTLTYDTNGANQTLTSVGGLGTTLLDDGLTLTRSDLVVGNATTSYVFGGWTISSTNYNGGDSYSLQADVTATAIWNAVVTTVYTVTYDGNSADSGSVAPDTGLSVTIAGQGNLLKSGYTFGGWSWNGNTYQQSDSFAFPTNADVTFTAIWNPIVYTVTFADGGATSGTAPNAAVSTAGSSIDFPGQGNLLKPGYSFDGWDINGVTHAANEKAYLPSGNETATAIWTAIVYHFVYNGNGNDGGTVPAGFDGYGDVTIVDNSGSLTNGSKVFGGWVIDGVTHLPGAVVSLTTGDVTAYALWVDSVYTLTYLDNGSAQSGTAPAAVTGYGLVELSSTGGSLTWVDHHVDGWIIDGLFYAVGADVDLTTGNLTAYAHWAHDQATITFTNAGADSGSAIGNVTVNTNSSIFLPGLNGLVKNGYYQSGWSQGGVEYALGDAYTVTGAAVLDPIWTAIVFTVTFDCTESTAGTCPSSLDSTAGSAILLPDAGDLENYGYTFGGWLINGVEHSAGESYVPAGDETATPIWTAIVYQVHYVGNGNTSGSAPADDSSVAFGGVNLAGKGSLSKAGYTFGGWNIGGTVYAAGDNYVPLTGDVTASAVWNAIVYTVTYAGNSNTGGSVPASGISTALSAVTLAGAGSLVKSGYTFGGWSIAGTTYAAGASFVPGANVTASAVWNAIVYTVTYAGNSNTGGSVPANGVSTAGSTVVLAGAGSLVKSGYTFGGWSIAGTTYAAGASFVPGANVTASAVWNAIVYTVSYAGNGNDAGSTPANGVSTAGSSVTLAGVGNLAKSGFTFGGWSIGGTTFQPGVTFIPGANVTATAVWVNSGAKTITYSNSGAASGTVPAATTGVGNVNLASNTGNLAKPGYTFGGWKINGTVYAAGATFNLNANAVASPVWNPIVYVITFDGSGNDGGSVPAAVSGYGRVTLSANTGQLTKFGYSFAGWSIGGATFAAGAGYNLTAGNVTATAVWNQLVYTASFSANGASGTVPTVILGFGPVTLPTAGSLSKLGFTFGGWGNGGVTYPAGSTFNLTSGNVILQAVWTPIVYNLTFSLNGGSGTTPAVISGFGAKTLPTALAFNRVGFTFVGWSDGNSTYEAGGRYSLTSGDQNLVATWTPIVYNLSYSGKDADGGNAPATDSGYGTKTVAGAGSLTRYGYVFVGWRIAGATYAPGASFDLTAGDATATPLWQKLIYTITYTAPEADSGSVAALSGYGTVKLSDGAKLVRTGFKLTGWAINNVVYPVGSNFSLNGGNVTASAVWTAVVFVITYGNNNATGGSAPAASSGFGTITLPTGSLTRTGYQLTGWRIDGQTYPLGSSYELTAGSFTATPVWTAISYTLTFDANGASGVVPGAVAGFGSITLPPANRLSLPGFSFAGWQVGGTTYDAGDTFNLSSGSVTAYAQWNAIVFSVNFTIPGATSGDAPNSIQGWGDLVLPKASGFKRLGYDFAGWKVGDTVYQPGQTVSVRRSDLTARATWQTQIVYKEFWGFAPGSPLLTADMKQQVSTWIKANPGFTVADCVGYTMGPTVLAVDKALATNRAQYTCGYVSNTFPRIDANGKWGGNDLVVGDPIRRVRITLHN